MYYGPYPEGRIEPNKEFKLIPYWTLPQFEYPDRHEHGNLTCPECNSPIIRKAKRRKVLHCFCNNRHKNTYDDCLKWTLAILDRIQLFNVRKTLQDHNLMYSGEGETYQWVKALIDRVIELEEIIKNDKIDGEIDILKRLITKLEKEKNGE